MNKREFLKSGASLAGFVALPALAQGRWGNRWGMDRGYPTGWAQGTSMVRDPALRVGNYSGGFELMLPSRTILPAPSPLPWRESIVKDVTYRFDLARKSADDYLDTWPATGLLVARDGQILLERYRFGRTSAMRMTSWSMAKSITSLLLGICLDRGLIASYDDPAQRYAPELVGTLHGEVTLRNLSNMSSGAEVVHDRDNAIIYPRALVGPRTDITATVAGWSQRREEQGRRYNYNELCALTVGIVIRSVTGKSLSEFAQEALWQPIGAESQATWLTDSKRNEFNCIGFAATLRDWARLGTLVANRGRVGNTQVISERWINELTRWGPLDSQVRLGAAMQDAGYKAFIWHTKPDGSRLYFSGFHGQRMLVDMPTRTVLVQTAVEHEGNWGNELLALLDAYTRV